MVHNFNSGLTGLPMDPVAPVNAATSAHSVTIQVHPTVASPFETLPESPHRKPLSMWPGMYHSPVTDALWKARSSIYESLWAPPLDGPPQQSIITRTPEESRVSITYNFTSDYILREQYRNAWNECQIGRIMEDLDALAGTIAVKVMSLFELKQDILIFFLRLKVGKRS
jgi:acyl-coenzyme A thioesterase 9